MARTWVLVADSSEARLFEVGGKPGERNRWKLLREFQNAGAREQGQDLIPNRGPQLQHSMDMSTIGRLQPSSLHQVEAMRFARELIAHLDRSLSQNAFDALVLVAPPAFMGDLRKDLTPQLERRLGETITKNYSSLDPRALQEAVPIA